ncbi:hypothetical protein, partial [Castellaniella sp.]
MRLPRFPIALAALLLAASALSAETAPIPPHAAHAAPTAAAQSLPAGIRQVVMIKGVAEYRLDNGLQVLLAP